MRKSLMAAAAIVLLAVPADGRFMKGSGAVRAEGEPGGGGAYINLIVREVRVSPVRARVGDTVRVDYVIESVGEGHETTTARLYANKRLVDSHLFTFDVSEGPFYRGSFFWNTAGSAPGEYRIRAEVFLWSDASPFDNEMTVAEPVVLLPAGAPVAETGGTAVETDPRYRPPAASSGSYR